MACERGSIVLLKDSNTIFDSFTKNKHGQTEETVNKYLELSLDWADKECLVVSSSTINGDGYVTLKGLFKNKKGGVDIKFVTMKESNVLF